MPHRAPVAPACLVIGVGNELRRDDAVGRAVAEAVARSVAGRPALAVDVRVTHQLVPELADVVRRYQRLVVVDAVAVDAVAVHDAAGHDTAPVPQARLPLPRAVSLRPAGRGCGATVGHVGDATHLLALAQLCGGPAPQSWLVTVPAADLGFGVGLSPATAALIGPAVDLVVRLVSAPSDEFTTSHRTLATRPADGPIPTNGPEAMSSAGTRARHRVLLPVTAGMPVATHIFGRPRRVRSQPHFA